MSFKAYKEHLIFLVSYLANTVSHNSKNYVKEEAISHIDKYYQLKNDLPVGTIKSLPIDNVELIDLVETNIQTYIQEKSGNECYKLVSEYTKKIADSLDNKESLVIAIPAIDELYSEYMKKRSQIVNDNTLPQYLDLLAKFESYVVEILTNPKTKLIIWMRKFTKLINFFHDLF